MPDALERELDLAGPDGLCPRLLSRMSYQGQPAIANYLGRRPFGNPRTWNSIQKLAARVPEVSFTAGEPTFRLLDPTPIDAVERTELVNRMITEYMKVGLMHEVVSTSDVLDPIRTAFGASRATCAVVQAARRDRMGLMAILFALRQAETRGDLSAYCEAFLEALECARCSSALPSLALLQPRLFDFLSFCFGAIELASNASLAEARETIKAATGMFELAQTKLRATTSPPESPVRKRMLIADASTPNTMQINYSKFSGRSL